MFTSLYAVHTQFVVQSVKDYFLCCGINSLEVQESCTINVNTEHTEFITQLWLRG